MDGVKIAKKIDELIEQLTPREIKALLIFRKCSGGLRNLLYDFKRNIDVPIVKMEMFFDTILPIIKDIDVDIEPKIRLDMISRNVQEINDILDKIYERILVKVKSLIDELAKAVGIKIEPLLTKETMLKDIPTDELEDIFKRNVSNWVLGIKELKKATEDVILKLDEIMDSEDFNKIKDFVVLMSDYWTAVDELYFKYLQRVTDVIEELYDRLEKSVVSTEEDFRFSKLVKPWIGGN